MNHKPLKLLFNTPHLGLQGGPPTHLPILERELRKYLQLETFRYGRQNDSEPLVAKLWRRLRDLLVIRSKILAFEPNIIHHNTAFDAIAILRDAPLLLLCKRYRIPILLKMHGSATGAFAEMNPFLTKMRNIVLRYADCIALLSEAEQQQFLNTWPFLAPRLKVVKNIIHPDFYVVERREAESPIVLFNSRFIRQKGPFDLLEASSAVIEKFPSARFIFLGSGAHALEFDQQVHAKGLNASVRRIDFIDNLATVPFYESAWVFVFPTHFPEGMPMVVAQALAAGLPIITTRTNFSQSYMQPFEHCLFVEHQNPRAIAEAILLLLENGILRNRMAANNRQLAEYFTTEVVTREFMEIYDDMLTASLASSFT